MPIGGFTYLALIISILDYRTPGIFAGEGGLGFATLGGLEIVHLIFAVIIGIVVGWRMIYIARHTQPR